MHGITLDAARSRSDSIRLRWNGEPNAALSALRRGRLPHALRQGRVLSPPRWPSRASIRCPSSVPPTESRHSAESRLSARISPAQGRQLHELHLCQSRPAPKDGSRRTPARLEIHPDDAGPRGIRKATRWRYSTIAAAFASWRRSTPAVPAGVVASRLNWNKLSPGGNNVNVLTSQRLTDIGRGPTFYSTLVEVARVAPSPHG